MSARTDRVKQVAEQILKAFKTGSVPKSLALVFLFRGLDIPSQKWSWRNQFIAAFHGHSDARGFRQWLAVGRHVRKGERAFYILAPCTRTAKDDDPDAGIEKGDVLVQGFRDVAVFGYAQTDGEPLPENQAALQLLPELPLREVAVSWGLQVLAAPTHLSGAAGIYHHGKAIELGVANLATWTHELVHAADDRLGKLRPSSKLSREVVAELGGAVLLEMLGHSDASDIGGAFEYITTYAKAENRTAWEVGSELLDRTCDCVDLILKTGEDLAQLSSAA